MKKLFLMATLVLTYRYANAEVSEGQKIAHVTAAGALQVDGSGVTQPVSGSLTIAPSTAPTPTGFVSGNSTVTVSASNPLPISGSLSLALPAVTTTTFNGVMQPVQVLQSTIGITSALPLTIVSTGVPVTGTFWPATQPVSGNVSVVQSTMAVVIPAGTPLTVVSTGLPVTGTFYQATQPISGTVSVGQSTMAIVNQAGTPLTVVSTGLPVTGTFWQTSQPVAATQSGTYTVTPGTGSYPVTGTFFQATQPVYTVQIPTVTFNGVAQQTTSTSTVITNSTVPVVNDFVVSSTSLVSPLVQGTTSAAYMDSIGRMLVTGLPYAVIHDTWNVLASTGTGEMVMVSSPTAPTRTFLCGCVFTSTGAINGNDLVIYSPTSAQVASVSHPVGMASGAPYILWPGCSQPFFWGPPGGQIVYKGASGGSTIKFHCQYYQSP